MWLMVLPIASSTGRHRSSTSSSPPTMIDSVPASAPWNPPDTGASSIAMPRSASAAAKRRVSTGEMELMSTRVLPGRIVSASPPDPKTDRAHVGRIRQHGDDDFRSPCRP
jgi:hypothetical protein